MVINIMPKTDQNTGVSETLVGDGAHCMWPKCQFYIPTAATHGVWTWGASHVFSLTFKFLIVSQGIR